MRKGHRGFGESGKHAALRRVEAVAPKARGDHGVIVRSPYAEVIAERIVTLLLVREGASASAVKHVVSHQPLNDPLCLLRVGDPRPQGMARGHDTHFRVLLGHLVK
jgi:hypothetical protein